MPNPQLAQFFDEFRNSFTPPPPKQGSNRRIVSGVWSDYLRKWLDDRFHVEREVSAGGGRRLDAALWFPQDQPDGESEGRGKADIALEWEWDHNKVHSQFASGDFLKVMEFPAASGLAIVHTIAATKGRPIKADESVRLIRAEHRSHGGDDRPVGLIEIRRTVDEWTRQEFRCQLEELGVGPAGDPIVWRYS